MVQNGTETIQDHQMTFSLLKPPIKCCGAQCHKGLPMGRPSRGPRSHMVLGREV